MSTISPENVPHNSWFSPTWEKMRELPFHTDNWSGGAKRTDRKTVSKLMEILVQILPPNAPPPSVVPTWLGGAQVEWHRNGVNLEISVNPGEAIEYYFNNGEEEWEGYARNDLPKLKKYARSIV